MTGRLIACLLVLIAGTGLAQALPREVRIGIIEAVVEVNAYDEESGFWAPFGGSGTIISRDGYVLTNYHVIGDDFSRTNYEWAGIFVTDTDAPYNPPELTWWAKFVAGDPRLDIALLQIVEDADSNPVPAGTIFPSVPVGNSDELMLGDPLTVVGYPGISGNTITFTRGIMGGWVGEDLESGGRRWIKTDAKIARGNSGGAGFSDIGHLMGIPTAGLHELDVDVYEEQLYMRPINVAWPLLREYSPNTRWAMGIAPTDAMMPEDIDIFMPAQGVPVGYGAIGALTTGTPASSTIAGADAEGLSYHTYTLGITEVPASVSVRVQSRDDVDLAVKLGAEIFAYESGDADFMDFSTDTDTSITFEVYEPTTVYVDVVNSFPYPMDYTLAVDTSVLQAGAWPEASGNGNRGTIRPGRTVLGNLAQHLQGISSGYHTYTLDIPVGTSQVEFIMEPQDNLGLAIKPGSDIESYTLLEEGGDAFMLQRVPSAPGTPIVMTVDAPAPGLWFIDVLNYADRAVDGRYSLTVNLK